jgi:glycosyltransferase involved in cell wall biosynthesis
LWTNLFVSDLARAAGVPAVADFVDSSTFDAFRMMRVATARHMPTALRRFVSEARAEALALRSVELATVAGAGDARTLRALGANKVEVVPNGVVVPDEVGATTDTPTVAFVGTLDFHPNVDAITSFVRNEWASIRRHTPNARLLIIGRNPVPVVEALAQFEGIELRADVPNVAHELTNAWFTIAPMRVGSGVKNKILESWASARPAVLSAHAVNGLQLPPGSEDLVYRNATELQSIVKRLLRDRALAEQLGQRAREFVQQHYSWSAVGARMRSVVATALRVPST